MLRLQAVSARDIRKGMRVIVRADLDVAMRGRATEAMENDIRVRAHEETLRILTKAGARIRIIAHRGRPGGARDFALTLAPVSRVLARILKRRVDFVSDPFLPAAYEKYNRSSDVLLFENLRFWPGEEKNSAAFARSLGRWGDIYVNEAFAVCHRTHASVVRLPALMPAHAGAHLVDEIAALERVMENPARPLVAVFGGAKIETKLPLIRRFVRIAEGILVGGALANALLAAAGKGIGRSRTDGDAKRALSLKNKKIVVPSDVVAADGLVLGAAHRIRRSDEVDTDEYIADIGPASRKFFADIIRDAGTVVWNGPMGYAEIPAYAEGTAAMARAMRASKAFTVVGGGDTIAALMRLGLAQRFSHISTGGGAMLEFLAGKNLPALMALQR